MKNILGAVCFVFLYVIITYDVFGDEPRQVVLTWQNSPMTTMTITWRTDDQGIENFVEVAETENSVSERRREYAYSFTFTETSAWIHTVELTDLTPGALYELQIYQDTFTLDPFTFHTAPDDTRDITFLVGGDSRTKRAIRREINRMAAEQSPDFVVFSGDMISNALSEDEWDDWFDDWHELMITGNGRRIPIVPAIGNHEVKGGYGGTKEDAPFFYNRFMIPDKKSYYSLQYGPLLHLVTLDSGHTASVSGIQEDWLEETLKKNQHIPWTVVQYHVAAFPSAREFDLPLQQSIRNTWVPLFEKYNVDLVCEAHDHAYKRTEPIRNNQIDYEHGVVYIGDGAWGAPLRSVVDPDDHWWLAEASSDYHFYVINIVDEGAVLSGEPIFYNQRNSGGTPFALVKKKSEDSRVVIDRLALVQNYPNPFNIETLIEFYLPSPMYVELSVYNVLGKRVDVLTENELPPGKNTILWNGRGLPSGLYFYQIRTPYEVVRNRMVLLR